MINMDLEPASALKVPAPKKVFVVGGVDHNGETQSICTDETGHAMICFIPDAVLHVLVDNFSAWGPSRSDIVNQARAGTMAATTSGPVAITATAATPLLSIANPANSGKVVYLASVGVSASTVAEVIRTRGATITGTASSLSLTVGAAKLTLSLTTSGTVAGGTREATLYTPTPETTVPGTIRLAPGESVSWTAKATTALATGFAAVSVQLWGENQ